MLVFLGLLKVDFLLEVAVSESRSGVDLVYFPIFFGDESQKSAHRLHFARGAKARRS